MTEKGKFHYKCYYCKFEVWADTEEALRELQINHYVDVAGSRSHS